MFGLVPGNLRPPERPGIGEQRPPRRDDRHRVGHDYPRNRQQALDHAELARGEYRPRGEAPDQGREIEPQQGLHRRWQRAADRQPGLRQRHLDAGDDHEEIGERQQERGERPAPVS